MAALLLATILIVVAAALLIVRAPHDELDRPRVMLLLVLAGVLATRAGFVFATILGGEAQSAADFISEIMLFGSAIVLLLISTRRARPRRQTPPVDSAALLREAQLRSAIDNTSDPIFVKDLEGRYTLMNKACAHETGRHEAEALGKKDSELWDERTARAFSSTDQPALQGETTTSEQIVPTPGGRRVYSTTKSPLRAADGRIVGVVGVARDITARKQAETELIELEIALEHAMPGIARVDAAGRYLAVNTAYAEMLGTAPRDMIGKLVRDTVHPDDHPLLAGLLQRLRETGSAEAELRGLRVDGREFFKHVFVVHPRSATVEGTYCFMRDITERKRLEERRLRNQKHEAVANLAGHMATDLSNHLTTILGAVDMLSIRLQSALHPDDPAFAAVANLRGAAGHSASLVRNLLAFSGQSARQVRSICLIKVLRGLEPMIRRLAGDNVRLQLDVDATDALIDADPVQIEQIVGHLVANARDAMPQGGDLSLHVTKDGGETHRPVVQTGPRRSGPLVCLRVRDTGIGMSTEVMQRLFEPFFSTKSAGRGAGLGLATVHSLVMAHNGSIEVTSEIGRGTEFRVYFPLSKSPSPESATNRPEAASFESRRPSSGPPTILVCESDMALSDLIARTLREEGHSVLCAASGREALRLARDHRAGSIHVVLTEAKLPDMSGRQIAELLRGYHPRAGIILMLVPTEESMTDSGYVDLGVATLEKPFSQADLMARVNAIIAGVLLT